MFKIYEIRTGSKTRKFLDDTRTIEQAQARIAFLDRTKNLYRRTPRFRYVIESD